MYGPLGRRTRRHWRAAPRRLATSRRLRERGAQRDQRHRTGRLRAHASARMAFAESSQICTRGTPSGREPVGWTLRLAQMGEWPPDGRLSPNWTHGRARRCLKVAHRGVWARRPYGFGVAGGGLRAGEPHDRQLLPRHGALWSEGRFALADHAEPADERPAARSPRVFPLAAGAACGAFAVQDPGRAALLP